ncbi:MAG: hypothetical protein JNJ71_04665 [Rubrivivax sp.]|nr:hypothetical protein [Rubrivivax sp.]
MNRRADVTRRRWLLGSAALLAAGALAHRSGRAQDPAEGAGLVETLDFDWADTSRQRAVPVRLHWPTRATAQRVPLIVFSHGIGGSRTGYRWLGRHLASQGIAALHLQHVGSDRQIWMGNVFQLVGRLQQAAQDIEAIQRVKDLRFALDTLLAGERGPQIDPSRIIAAGHSYGANTTLLASGARVLREGQAVSLRDPRLSAAIIISAPPFYGESDLRGILAGVQLPTLHVTATEDIIRIPGYYSGAEDRIAVFEATASAHKWLAVYAGGSHSMFTDRMGTGGTLLNPQVKAATQQLVLAFVHQVFEGDGRELAAWPQQHAPLLARFDTAGPPRP